MSAVLLGDQRPRIELVPPYVSSSGVEAIELAATAGLHLDPWQQWALTTALGERQDGLWSAFEVGLIVSRQNGKGSILEARELAGLFLLGERLILHSAHEFKTAQEAFLRIRSLIEQTPSLSREVKTIRTSHGEEGIELRNGARLRFVARSTGSGRGFSGDLVILDEAYNLGDDAMRALLPTLSARPNPQLWYTSSAGGPLSVQLARVRKRGISGWLTRRLADGTIVRVATGKYVVITGADSGYEFKTDAEPTDEDGALAFMEWSVPDKLPVDQYGKPARWRQANPAYGIRITEDYIRKEHGALSAEAFGRERLAVGDYPVVDRAGSWAVIPEAMWSSLADAYAPRPNKPQAFGVEVTVERSHAAIGFAGRVDDGRMQVGLTDYKRGTGWVPARLRQLVDDHDPCAVVIDPRSPAGSLIEDVEALGIEVLKTSAQDIARACGAMYDAVCPAEGEPTLQHRDQAELNTAVSAAQKRDLGDSWAFSRKLSILADISPLMAVTLAAFGHSVNAPDWEGDYDILSSVY